MLKNQKFIDEISFQRNSIQLINAELINVDFRNFGNAPEGKKKLNFQLSNDIEMVDKKAEIFLTAIIGSEKSTGFEMEIVYKGIVIATPGSGLTEEELKEYANQHIVPMLLPYIREVSTSLISRTTLSRFILPTLDVLNFLSGQKLNEKP